MSLSERLQRASTAPIDVWLVDEQRLPREGLSLALTAISPMLRVTATATWEEIAGSTSERPNVWVLNLGSGSPLDPRVAKRATALLSSTPGVPLIIVSSQSGLQEITAALQLGARGFFSAALNTELLAEAIRLVHAGGIFLPPDAIATVLHELPTAS